LHFSATFPWCYLRVMTWKCSSRSAYSLRQEQGCSSRQQLYREDNRPWLVGFSGGKDSTMLASLIFDELLSLADDREIAMRSSLWN